MRAKLEVIGREPLVHFLVLGFLLWIGLAYWHGKSDRYVIHLERGEQQRIAAGYYQQFGQPPTPTELRSLIDRYVREEIYLREGMALNLGADDEIVRRRVIQKFEFLQTDLAVPDRPAAGVLELWFDRNKARYLRPERVTFTQIYFSADRDGDEGARRRALGILRKVRELGASRAPDLGDPFPGPPDVAALSPEEAARLFGQSEFSEQLFKLPVGTWAGPYRSGYGWHLVEVADRVPSTMPSFGEVRDRVLADYLDEQRRLLDARNFATLRAKYTVVTARAR